MNKDSPTVDLEPKLYTKIPARLKGAGFRYTHALDSVIFRALGTGSRLHGVAHGVGGGPGLPLARGFPRAAEPSSRSPSATVEKASSSEVKRRRAEAKA